MKVNEVLVVGGSGFIGRHLVAALTAAGMRVAVPTRRRERAKHLILLPTVDVVECDVMAPGVLERLCAGKQAAVNLVGILHSRRGRADERGPNDYGPDFARLHVELPQAVLAACRAAGVPRLLHMSALGASPTGASEYQRSKGIGEHAVVYRHALRNALLPVVTIIGMNMRTLITGAVLTETVFAWPGLGRLTYDAVYMRDYPVLMAMFVIVGILVVLANLLTDIVYAYLDPRIRYGK